MWNTPTKNSLATIPDLYETEKISLKDKIIHQHFFNGDYDCAEWGYISFEEMKQLKVKPFGFEIDRETGWVPCKACEIEKIRQAQGW